MRKEETERTYPVPDNFMDTGRMLNGMFSTRCFFEGLAAALPVLAFVLSSALPQGYRLPLAIFLSGAVFLAFNRNDGRMSPGQKLGRIVSFLLSARRYEYDPDAGTGFGTAEDAMSGTRLYMDMAIRELAGLNRERERRSGIVISDRKRKDETHTERENK